VPHRSKGTMMGRDDAAAPITELTPEPDEKHLFELFRSLRRRTLRRGERLFSPGEPAASIFFVTRGALRAEARRADGWVLLDVVRTGRSLGAPSALCGTPREVTALAAEDCEVAELDLVTLEIFRRVSPEAHDVLLVGVGDDLQRRVDDGARRLMGAYSILGVSPADACDDSGNGSRSGDRRVERFTEDLLSTLGPGAALLALRKADEIGARPSGPSAGLLVVKGAVEAVRTLAGRERRVALLEPGSTLPSGDTCFGGERGARLRATGLALCVPLSDEVLSRFRTESDPLARRFRELTVFAAARQLLWYDRHLAVAVGLAAERLIAKKPPRAPGVPWTAEALSSEEGAREWIVEDEVRRRRHAYAMDVTASCVSAGALPAYARSNPQPPN